MWNVGGNYTEEFSEEEQSKIKDEFARLEDICYLDQTGSALYSHSYIEAVSRDLCKNVYSNPHSNNLTSKLCLDTIDQVRYRILQHFNTNSNEYSVVFTSGATGALKLVGESFVWEPKYELQDDWNPGDKVEQVPHEGELVYMEDNHTSVLGMRNVVKERGAKLRCLTHDETLNLLNSPLQSYKKTNYKTNSLFVYSAQCNFSGVKYPLSWVEKVQNGALSQNMECSSHWYCLLDAATYVSTNHLDLSVVKPDFICISFYKIFGYPTGLGALLVKNTSASVLQKTYYGGGTVLIALSSQNAHVPRSLLHERFEDGSLNFLSLVSLQHGFRSMETLVGNMERVSRHCFSLAQYVFTTFLRMHHSNGAPVVRLYIDSAYDDIISQGNIVNFNVCRSNGEYVGYAEVLNMSNLHGIQLRTGCFCNPGACRRHLGLSVEQLKLHYQAGHVCGDDKDLVEGIPTGSVRASFGLMNTKEDAKRLISLIEKCYVEQPVVWKLPSQWDSISTRLRDKFSTSCIKQSGLLGMEHVYLMYSNLKDTMFHSDHNTPEISMESTNLPAVEPEEKKLGEPFLSHIFLYPIKSCGKHQVQTWQLDSKGLKYDRMWMITNESGVALTQKREPKLCLINPTIDFLNNKLCISYNGAQTFCIDLEAGTKEKYVEKCQSKVCGDRVQGVDCGDDVAAWLSQVLDRLGLRLIRQLSSDSRASKKHSEMLSLANQAQYLLINKSSVDWLGEKLDEDSGCLKESLLDRFRSNFVISGLGQALLEQTWSQVNIGKVGFKVEGPCGRCQMICVDQNTGSITKEPLTTLSVALQGKLKFGIYLTKSASSDVIISVADPVTFL